MKRLSILILLSTTLAACSGNANKEQTNSDTTVAVTTQPVNQCSYPAAMEKIRKAISVGSVTGMTEEEEKEWLARTDKLLPGESGITDYSVDTLFNEHCILSVDAFAESMGAYPSSWHTYLNFDMNTGDSLLSSMIIDRTQVSGLLKICNQKVQQAIVDNRKEWTGEELETYNDLVNMSDRTFKEEDLSKYFLSGDSITFVYDFEFPHFAQNMSPTVFISFNHATFRPFLKKDGPLGYWVK